jgi:hypothetical protein
MPSFLKALDVYNTDLLDGEEEEVFGGEGYTHSSGHVTENSDI